VYHNKLAVNRRRAIDVKDPTQWASVEQELKDFQQERCTKLAIDLLYRYEKQGNDGTLPVPGVVSRSKQLIQPTGQATAPRTPTEALLMAREVANEDPAKLKHDEILRQWNGTDKSCKNFDEAEAYCYIDRMKNSEHVWFNTHDAKL